MWGGGLVLKSRRPLIGNHPSRAPSHSWSMIANQNTGRAVPRIDVARNRWVPGCRGRHAASIPPNTPATEQSTKLYRTSSSVAGIARDSWGAIGVRLTYDTPRSPWVTPEMYETY